MPSFRRPALPFLVLVLVGGLAFALGAKRAASAEPTGQTIYVSITGDGPNAKAWYAGASPSGVAVQDALTVLSNAGYRVKSLVAGDQPIVVAQGASSSTLPERTYVLLLER